MTNQWGLDVNYAQQKLRLILRDIYNYTPQELQRELERLIEATTPPGGNT